MKIGIAPNDMREIFVLYGSYGMMLLGDGIIDETLSGNLISQFGANRSVWSGQVEVSSASPTDISFLKTVYDNPNGLIFEDEEGEQHDVFWEGAFSVSWISGVANICRIQFQFTEKK